MPSTAELRQAFKSAVTYKRWGKLAISIDWALDQLINNVPENTDDLPGHADFILSTMQKKSVNLPEFFMNVLHGMQNPAGAEAGTAAAALDAD
jgi:hypothetical protein